jgi:hypothetical protein
MIRLLPLGEYQISPSETPKTLIDRLMTFWCLNFTADIQETQTGKFLAPDEPMIDGREYYITFGYIN